MRATVVVQNTHQGCRRGVGLLYSAVVHMLQQRMYCSESPGLSAHASGHKQLLEHVHGCRTWVMPEEDSRRSAQSLRPLALRSPCGWSDR